METKPLLFGLIGFFMGGLIVSVAATTFEKPELSSSNMSMSHMTKSLAGKQGDAFDEAFIQSMIEHHQGAVDMAKLASTNAKHAEIKELSESIISAQNQEIETMKRWQIQWGYDPTSMKDSMSH